MAGRARPYVDTDNPHDFQLFRGFSEDKYRSFPSGHTINAFAFASTRYARNAILVATFGVVRRDSDVWWRNSHGLSRMYNNQHWASDVMGGAAIGTLIGLKVVKYTHSHPGNGIDSKLIKGGKNSQRSHPDSFLVSILMLRRPRYPE